MARIRSIHPGLFTDEAFASASPMARLLAIGLWTEAWDDGVFEWKPLSLKMRIFPADNADVGALLSELASLNIITAFDADGKKLGAVRNFVKFQRPKKPNSSGMLPGRMRKYVGFTDAGSEPIPDACGDNSVEFRTNASSTRQSSEPVPNQDSDSIRQFGTSSEPVRNFENRGRMEDGGWRGIDNPDSELSTTRERARSVETELRMAIVDAFASAGRAIPPETGHCAVWLAQGFPPDLCLSVIRSKLPGACDKGLKWFDKAIAEAFTKRASNAPDSPASSPPQPTAKRRIWSRGCWSEMCPEFEPTPPGRIASIPFEPIAGRDDALIAVPGGGYRWESEFRAHLRQWVDGDKRRHLWVESRFGTIPSEPGCSAPDDLLEEFGLDRVPYPREDEDAA